MANTISSEVLRGVRAHALEHYETDGWDFVYDCLSDSDLEKELLDLGINSNSTTEQAIQAIGEIAKEFDTHRTECV